MGLCSSSGMVGGFVGMDWNDIDVRHGVWTGSVLGIKYVVFVGPQLGLGLGLFIIF